MTNATPEQLDLARKIAIQIIEQGPIPGMALSQQAALAAIIETTERAAKLSEWPKEAPTNNEFARGMATACAINRDALRNQEHLKND